MENGKRVIWTTDEWITNLCEDCAKEHLKKCGITEDKIEESLAKMKNVLNVPFGFQQFSKDSIKTVTYKETDDGWLEVDSVTDKPREISQ